MDNITIIKEKIKNQITRDIYRSIDTIEEKQEKLIILNKVTNNLLDLNQDRVVPFSILQTSKIRTNYGISNETIYPTKQPINLERILIRYIYTEYNYQKQQTIFNKLDESKKTIKDQSIHSLSIDNKAMRILINNRIFTIGHLLNRKKIELLQLSDINQSTLERIIKQIHDLGLRFIDELDIETQKEIIKANIIYTEIEKILPQTICNYLKENNIYTAQDLTRLSETELLRLRNFGSKKIKLIKEKLAQLGLKLKEDYINQETIKENDLYSERIIYILPENIANPLIRAKIYTLKDLTEKSEINLLNVYSIGPRKIEIIKERLSSLGLTLKDDKEVYKDKDKLLDFPIYMLFPSWITNCLKIVQVNTLRQLLELSIID